MVIILVPNWTDLALAILILDSQLFLGSQFPFTSCQNMSHDTLIRIPFLGQESLYNSASNLVCSVVLWVVWQCSYFRIPFIKKSRAWNGLLAQVGQMVKLDYCLSNSQQMYIRVGHQLSFFLKVQRQTKEGHAWTS